jgi:adenine specific DNA methylase Mod
MSKEEKFYKALEDLFIGAKIEGEGGFVNLMRIKSSYYSKIREHLEKDIEKALEKYPKFREELFDKLYSFFSRYFTKSGSIYFNYTPFFQNVYDKVYTDDKDVILFWKTRMLYYVKTDRIFKNLKIEIEDKNETYQFFFDVSNLEYKKANEKRSLVYQFKKISSDGTIFFDVFYSEKGRQTKYDEIKKSLKEKGIKITDEVLDKAFSTFEAQSEVDYFINKNAKEFLQEQFKLWLYQYTYSEETEWPKERIDQLQILKDIAFKIIDFISQFEDELVKIWNKPKFVLNSNYVITLDKIAKKSGFAIIEKIQKHKNFKDQIKEWKELGILEKEPGNLLEKTLTGLQLKKEYQFLPIDTKYFKDLELEILSLFDNLDQSLDGWLIKSENYQALNTILPKFREKVQTIYIDPPFNTGEDFVYVDRFQDSNWLSLIENRLSPGKDFINQKGSFFLHLDYRANFLGRQLLDEIFGEDNLINEIIYAYRIQGILQQGFPRKHDTIFFYAKDADKLFFKPIKERVYYEKPFFNPAVDEQGRYYADVFIRDVWDHDETKPLISGSKEFQDFRTQKSEGLLKRIIETTTDLDDFVMDFFLGSGTTIAVAHKLKRKWIGVEMGEHFYGVVLPRMKKVLAYDKSGISKEKDVKEKYNENNAGGFFKYYELEQYEDVLRKAKYEDSDLFSAPNQSPYEQYIFFKDKKLLDALEIDYQNNKVKVDLSKIYSNIDIAETISNLKGKWIKRITENEVELADYDEEGKAKYIEKVDLENLDYKEIKKLIWW